MVEEYMSSKECLERLVRLESEFALQVKHNDKALILAREIVQNEVKLAQVEVAATLEMHNQWQR